MYYVIKSAHRALNTVPFYGGSAPSATAAAAALVATYPAAPAYAGAQSLLKANGLFSLIIEKWSTQAANDAWILNNNGIITSYNTARSQYNIAHAITFVETSFTSASVLF